MIPGRATWAAINIAVLLLAAPPAASAHAQQSFRDLPSDPVLDQLIHESLAVRPELSGARQTARAESAAVPQAGALPDPVLSLGVQNDGFRSIQIGKAETSFWKVELSQSLPWPGKRDLRTQAIKLSAERAEAYIDRARLSAEADVRRGYLDLILLRERLTLLNELTAIWEKSEALARTRYEAGQGAQSDALRAQLELHRLRQRRFRLEADERRAVQTLNRLRARPLEESIATTTRVSELDIPAAPDLEVAVAAARARSPELAAAQLDALRARKLVDLAQRERFPDLGVSGAVMPRGDLPPMWAASMSVGLPLWTRRKQGQAVVESAARAAAETQSAEATAQVVSLRAAERVAALGSLVETIRLYREGLLTLSQSTVESTLAQYRVGNVTFASVLEANIGYLDDREGHLTAVADALRTEIASAEVALDASSAGGSSMGGGQVPNMSAAQGRSAAGGGSAPSQTASGSSSSAPKM